MTPQSTTAPTPRDLAAQLRACQAENARLRKELSQKDQLLEEMAEKIRELERTEKDAQWHETLDKVSYKRLKTPPKLTLAVLRDIRAESPQREDGMTHLRFRTLADRRGISYDTARRHVRELASLGLVIREYEGNGEEGSENRTDFYFDIDQRILDNPLSINKIVPLERRPASSEEPVNQWGGKREKKPDPEIPECPNCGSPWTKGEKHLSGVCYGCHRSFDEWTEFDFQQPKELVPA